MRNARRTEDDFDTSGFERVPEAVHVFCIAAGLTGLQKGEVASLLLDELIHQDKFLAGLDRIVAAVDENQRQRCRENATKISFPPAGE